MSPGAVLAFAGGQVQLGTGAETGATVVRVPQTSDRKGAAAVVTAWSDTGDIVIDELR